MVALLGTIQYSGATHTSATSLPLPLTSLCPGTTRLMCTYIGIYRRSRVVRFVGGSYIVIVWHFYVPVPYGGSSSVLGCCYLYYWFAGFMRVEYNSRRTRGAGLYR